MLSSRRPLVALLAPFALLTALAALLLVPAGVASAHDQLIGSSPEEGSTAESPEELVLTFSGQIAELGVQVQVSDPDGESVVEGDPVVEGVDVTQDLVDGLVAGDYEVLWRVTSEDGHPISGEFGFTVEVAEPEATEEATTEETSTQEATSAAATDEATEDATEEAIETTEVTSEAEPTAEATDDAAEPEEGDGGGMPTWAWVVIGLAALGVAGLLGRTWARGRE